MRALFLLLFALASASAAVDFDREVRPILSDNCFACHGPDGKRRIANVRLDTEEGLAAVKGRIAARVSAPTPARRMPPPQATTKLTEPQIATIVKWIDQG